MGGCQQQQQPVSLRSGSGTLVSSHPSSGTPVPWKSSSVKIPGLGASLKPPTNSIVCFVIICTELLQM